MLVSMRRLRASTRIDHDAPFRTHAPLIVAIAIISAVAAAKKVKIAKPPKIGSSETGVASWYGHPYHGRRAANGEIYDMEKMTAAHRTDPFNTWVRVKNLSNDRTVDVRIQDRGPSSKAASSTCRTPRHARSS